MHSVVLWHNLLFENIFLKRKESLTEIVEKREQYHTSEHSRVLLNGYAETFEQVTCQGFCYSVGDKIANGNVYYKSNDYVQVTLFIFKCIVFIQIIAQDASKEIIGCRGQPIAEMEYIVKHKHNSGTEQGVDTAYENEFPECFVRLLINHNCSLANILSIIRAFVNFAF